MPNSGPLDDLHLVHRILDGSLEAWHEFIESYTGLLNHTIRRVLRDHDDVATVYVAVLERLYRGRLAQYRGESRLGTWLVFVARSAALDHLRRRRGRRRPPGHLQAAGEADREAQSLRFEPARRQATAVAAESGRLLAYLEQQRVENEERMWAQNPETLRLEREALAATHRIRAAIANLPAADREVLALRFERGFSARQIARHLGLSSQRRAFTILDATLRRVRRAMQVSTERGAHRGTGAVT